MYALICRDKADGLELRMATRAEHLAWAGGNADKIHFAGPMVDDDDTTLLGSVFLLTTDSRAEVEAFSSSDPYTKAGLWQSVEIQRVRQAIPPPAR